MVMLPPLLELLNESKNRVLLVAQASMPESQFQAFRRIFLDEFGKKGLEGKLARLFGEDRNKDRQG